MNPKLRKQVRSQTLSIPKRLNVAELQCPTKQLQLQTALEEKIASMSNQMHTSGVDAHWETLQHIMYETALETTGTAPRRKQDWFDENDDLIKARLKKNILLMLPVFETPCHKRLVPNISAYVVQCKSC